MLKTKRLPKRADSQGLTIELTAKFNTGNLNFSLILSYACQNFVKRYVAFLSHKQSKLYQIEHSLEFYSSMLPLYDYISSKGAFAPFQT